MGFATEFKEFAMKGNVVDLAVGVIIGAAFGKIVSSLVENVIMPPVGLALSGVNFADLAVTLALDPTGKPVLLRYGAFLQSIFDFLVIAVVIFIAIKAINRLQASPAVEPPAAAPAPAEPPRQEALLEEIRDLLKQSR